MQTYDIVMLVILLGATLFGFWKGMAWQLASLASLGVSYFAAMNFSAALAPHIAAEAPWNRFLAMLIIYVGVSVAIWMSFRLVAASIDRVKLQEFDRQVGALFGAFKGLLFCLAVTFFAVSLSVTAREHILKTRSGYYAALAMDRAHPILPAEFRELLEPYIHHLDAALPEDDRQHAHDHAQFDHAAHDLDHADSNDSRAPNSSRESAPASSGEAAPAQERRDWTPGGEFVSELERVAKDVIATEAAKRWAAEPQPSSSPSSPARPGATVRRPGTTTNVR